MKNTAPKHILTVFFCFSVFMKATSAQETEAIDISTGTALRTINPYDENRHDLAFQYQTVMDPLLNGQWSTGVFSSRPVFNNKFKSNPELQSNFYSVQHGTIVNQDFVAFDQSSAYYFIFKGGFRLGKKRHEPLTRKHILIVGITHDKLQTPGDDGIPKYKFDNGGTELTVMLKHEYNLLSNRRLYQKADTVFRLLNDKMEAADDKLLFNIGIQGGVLVGLDDIDVKIPLSQTDTMVSSSPGRSIANAVGLIGSANVDFGIKICDMNHMGTWQRSTNYKDKFPTRTAHYYRKFYITFSTRLTAELLYSYPKVYTQTGPARQKNFSSAYTLQQVNFCFFSSPSLNLIFTL